MADIGSTVPKTRRDGKIELISLERTLEVKYEAGDFSASGLKPEQRDTTMILDRGEFLGVRQTNFEPVTFSFTALLTDLSDGTDTTIPDMLLRTGACASDVSTLGANAEVYTVKLTWTIEGTDHGDSADHTLEWNHCTIDALDFSEGDPSTIAVSGTAYSTAVMT